MKIIGIEDEKNKKKINSKKILAISIIVVVLIVLAVLFIVYSAHKPFRDMVDKYILMKNVVEDSSATISVDESENNNIYAYDKYICILNKNTLTNYNSSGKQEGQISVEITTPIVSTNGKYFLIAEKGKNKIYLISGNEIIWEKELEGNIDKISVNKNGYVAVVLSETTYKTVIQTYDDSGDELFKTYLSSTIAMDVDISVDNQYLSFLEINTSGTMAQSIIKTVSIQKAKQKAKDSSIEPIVYAFADEEGHLITNIKYQEGNRLLCMYDDSIHLIKNDKNEKVLSFVEDGAKVSFADIELSSNIYRIIEKSSLLSTQTTVEIYNTPNQNLNIYTFEGVTKESYSYNDTIAINTGSEVHFISSNGWLKKKYISNQEVKNVVMCNNFAGIVYRNKIEIVNI